MKTLSKITAIALLLIAFTFTSNVNAQNGGGGTDNNNGQHNDTSGSTQYNGASTNNNGNGGKSKNNSSVPLDGGLSILLLGAAAFGVKKLRENKS